MIPRIFVTVGTQLPFDRLVGAVANWHQTHRAAQITMQTGPTALSQARLSHIDVHGHMDLSRFDAVFAAADLVVSHAGMGTILSAAEVGKPVVILPRRADLGEHPTAHQLATPEHLAVLSNVTCAMTTLELAPLLDGFVSDWHRATLRT